MVSIFQAFVKTQKTKAYSKRYQVKYKRRRGSIYLGWGRRCHLQLVADVDDEGVGLGMHRNPLPVFENLQARDVGILK